MFSNAELSKAEPNSQQCSPMLSNAQEFTQQSSTANKNLRRLGESGVKAVPRAAAWLRPAAKKLFGPSRDRTWITRLRGECPIQ